MRSPIEDVDQLGEVFGGRGHTVDAVGYVVFLCRLVAPVELFADCVA